VNDLWGHYAEGYGDDDIQADFDDVDFDDVDFDDVDFDDVGFDDEDFDDEDYSSDNHDGNSYSDNHGQYVQAFYMYSTRHSWDESEPYNFWQYGRRRCSCSISHVFSHRPWKTPL